MLTPATAYKVAIDVSNATPLKVTGAMSATGAVSGASAAITNAVVAATVNATTGNITTVVATTVNATNANVTGNAVLGTVNATTLKIGASGGVINSILTYTSAAANIAAVNVLATQHQMVDLTVTGVLTTDTILAIVPTNVVANQVVSGNVITAANNVTAAIFSSVNTNAATGQTFAVTVKR